MHLCHNLTSSHQTTTMPLRLHLSRHHPQGPTARTSARAQGLNHLSDPTVNHQDQDQIHSLARGSLLRFLGIWQVIDMGIAIQAQIPHPHNLQHRHLPLLRLDQVNSIRLPRLLTLGLRIAILVVGKADGHMSPDSGRMI